MNYFTEKIGKNNTMEESNTHYSGIICPHCGCETGVEPALVHADDPMIYCPDCDEPLFTEDFFKDSPPDAQG